MFFNGFFDCCLQGFVEQRTANIILSLQLPTPSSRTLTLTIYNFYSSTSAAGSVSAITFFFTHISCHYLKLEMIDY